MQDYHKLKVWTRAHGLALRVYRYTARFPREERFTLVTQMRRSAGSVPTVSSNAPRSLVREGSK